MKTGEFAKLARVEKRTLLFYDEIGLLKPSKVNENGYREYEREQLNIMDAIKLLQLASFSLQEIKEILSKPVEERTEFFKKAVNRIQDQINRLCDVKLYYENKVDLIEKYKMHKERELFEEDISFRYDIIEDAQNLGGSNFNYINFNIYTGFLWYKFMNLFMIRNSENGKLKLKGKGYSFYEKIPSKAFKMIAFVETRRMDYKRKDSDIVIIRQVPHVLFYEEEKALIKVTFVEKSSFKKNELK